MKLGSAPIGRIVVHVGWAFLNLTRPSQVVLAPAVAIDQSFNQPPRGVKWVRVQGRHIG